MIIAEISQNFTCLDEAKELVRLAKENGAAQYKRDKNSQLYVFRPCAICNEYKWVKYRKGQPETKRCRICANRITRLGKIGFNWKGGRRKFRGYAYIYIRRNSEYLPMANRLNRSRTNGEITSAYVLEHRLMMAKHIGRLLADDEVVHHVNGNKLDNRLDNLYLTSYKNHPITYNDAFTRGYNLGYGVGLRSIGKY